VHASAGVARRLDRLFQWHPTARSGYPGDALYGFTCEGRILQIDTSTGHGIELGKITAAFEGGAGR
jgi:hypothetical protein